MKNIPFFFIVLLFLPSVLAQKVPYTYFTPIARFFLDNIPSVYNPLFSTFYNRTVHVDDDYHLPTPICYVGQGESFKFDFTPPEDGKIRIEMEFPDAKSPSELGMSGDTRKLALAIKSLVIQ